MEKKGGGWARIVWSMILTRNDGIGDVPSDPISAFRFSSTVKATVNAILRIPNSRTNLHQVIWLAINPHFSSGLCLFLAILNVHGTLKMFRKQFGSRAMVR